MVSIDRLEGRLHVAILAILALALIPGCAEGVSDDPYGTVEIFIEGDTLPIYRWEPDVGMTQFEVSRHTCEDHNEEEVDWVHNNDDLAELIERGGNCDQSTTLWQFRTPNYSDEEIDANWELDSYKKSTFSGPITHGALPDGDIIDTDFSGPTFDGNVIEPGLLYRVWMHRAYDKGHETDGFPNTGSGEQYFRWQGDTPATP